MFRLYHCIYRIFNMFISIITYFILVKPKSLSAGKSRYPKSYSHENLGNQKYFIDSSLYLLIPRTTFNLILNEYMGNLSHDKVGHCIGFIYPFCRITIKRGQVCSHRWVSLHVDSQFCAPPSHNLNSHNF